MKLKQEVEQTFESEHLTFASWMALKCAEPEGQHFTVPTAPLQTGSSHWSASVKPLYNALTRLNNAQVYYQPSDSRSAKDFQINIHEYFMSLKLNNDHICRLF